MTIFPMILIILLTVFTATLILFPNFRKKLKVLCGGFLNLLVEDKAKTPEGARAIYNQAIEDAEIEYAKTHDVYVKVSGQLSGLEKKKEDLTVQLGNVEAACERFVKANEMHHAKTYALKREEIKEQLVFTTQAIERLKPAVQNAKLAHTEQEKKVSELKRKSKNVVQSMELNKQLQEALDDVSNITGKSATNKLLEAVDDAYNDSNEKAAGVKIAYENKVSTKIQKAENESKRMETDAYLEQLKSKYNK